MLYFKICTSACISIYERAVLAVEPATGWNGARPTASGKNNTRATTSATAHLTPSSLSLYIMKPIRQGMWLKILIPTGPPTTTLKQNSMELDLYWWCILYFLTLKRTSHWPRALCLLLTINTNFDSRSWLNIIITVLIVLQYSKVRTNAVFSNTLYDDYEDISCNGENIKLVQISLTIYGENIGFVCFLLFLQTIKYHYISQPPLKV